MIPSAVTDDSSGTPDSAAWEALRAWERDCAATTRERGADYAHKGRVQKLFLTSDTITGIVKGSESLPYRTTLTFNARRRHWSATCDCPVGIACKHAVAVALQALRAAPKDDPGAVSASAVFSMADELVATVGAATPRKLTRPQMRVLELVADIADSLAKDQSATRSLEFLFREIAPYSRFEETTRFAREVEDANPEGVYGVLAAVALARDGMYPPLPDWLAVAIPATPAGEVLERMRAAEALREWRGILTGLAKDDVPVPPARIVRSAPLRELRLKRLSPWLFAWQTRPDADSEWSLLDASLKRDLLAQAFVPEVVFAESSLVAARACRQVLRDLTLTAYDVRDNPAAASVVAKLVGDSLLRVRILDADDSPLRVLEEKLVWSFRASPMKPGHLRPYLSLAGGASAPSPLVALGVWRLAEAGFLRAPRALGGYTGEGAPPDIPAAVFEDEVVKSAVQKTGARVIAASELKLVRLRPRVRVTVVREPAAGFEIAVAELEGVDDAGAVRLRYDGKIWMPVNPPGANPDEQPDLASVERARAHFDLAGTFDGRRGSASLDSAHVGHYADWLAGFPRGTLFETPPELAALLRPADRADFVVELEEAGRDWFDLKLVLKPADAELAEADMKLLLAHRGEWVRVPGKGWRRLEVDLSDATRDKLDELGLDASAPAGERLRYHAAQLGGDKLAGIADETTVAAVRARAARLATVEKPALPAGLSAQLRPYQHEGYHFLAHLSSNGLGGVLADDMGLGKTLQTIAWLLWLKGSRAGASERASKAKRKTHPQSARFRALIVAPKSVAGNWVAECGKFAPALKVAVYGVDAYDAVESAEIVVVNYTRLRIASDEFLGAEWTAVVLDEGQHIKNPTSQAAETAHALKAEHRLVLSGTPVENRLLDLWSLFAFAMPGLLGTHASFKRHYDEKRDPKAAGRLAARVRPFLLRRTKSQVAKDLPARIEEDLVVELEPAQRKLYDAELKRARSLLLAAKSARDFDKSRFNILSSLLRLRQICCDPRLVSPKAKSGDSAKLDALWDLIEPLVAEGHKVLVFSQFTEALQLVGEKLESESVPFLKLTGATENRAELVERFQKPETEKVFLLSLKAAGTGLNLTAASYVVLFDPWWNPAAEAQAIDRTHRIGQKNKVIAYRLIVKGTVEEKIRALQRDKAALAGEILQEESLAKVLDIDTLRGILAE